MRVLSALVGSCLLSIGIVKVHAVPESCKGICTNAHDSSVIRRDDGTYFRFSTGNKISIHSASDLAGSWEYRGFVLPSSSKINLKGNDDVWAPDVSKVGNMYYLYYSVSTFGTQNSAIGLAQSKTMEPGSWVDTGSTGVTSNASKSYNAIDPNLFQVGSEFYLNFGSFWQGLYQTKMASVPATSDSDSAHQIAYTSTPEVMEAAFEFANSGYYYLFFSKGSCCGYDKTRPLKGKEYRILVCRSKSPMGGFVDKSGKDCRKDGGTVVLKSHKWVYGPGGQGFFTDSKHGTVLYYHYVDTRIGFADRDKRFGWNKLSFSSGWPVVVEPTEA